MNQNIERINPNLWAVNYHHLEFMKDITYQDTSPDAMDKPASLSNDGILVLNKGHELYPTLKLFIPKLMESNDVELLNKIRFMKDKDRDGYDRVYKFCLEAEARRRLIEKEFQEQNKEKPVIKRMLNFLGFSNKKGVK